MNIVFTKNASVTIINDIDSDDPDYTDELIVAGSEFYNCDIVSESNGLLDVKIGEDSYIMGIPNGYFEVIEYQYA